MRCNACWKELEGRAVTTTCGHIFCTEDASKIISNEAACPICDLVLSKSHMKPVDISPNDEWTNMAMVGVSPQILMKSAYRSVMFYISQKELEMQCKMNRIMSQCQQKCEMMREKFTEKLEQVHTAYQKMAKRCQMMEQEIENLSKDKQELQEKFAEKSRQKRKLDEMYDQLRNEYESVKRSAIQPASSFYPRDEPVDLFTNPTNMMGNMDSMRKDWGVLIPGTPGQREDVWATTTRQAKSNAFDIQGGSVPNSVKTGNRRHNPFDIQGGSAPNSAETGKRRQSMHPSFGPGVNNTSNTLRNLIISPIKRPQLSRNRQNLFRL